LKGDQQNRHDARHHTRRRSLVCCELESAPLEANEVVN
jgi:hypothetical protein